jgi:uncharacterized protein
LFHILSLPLLIGHQGDVMNKMLHKLFSGFLVLTLSLVLISPVQSVQALISELFFSEYVEGSSLNKALEIYNGTGAAADLSQYSLELYSNGAASPSQSITLSTIAASLADGDVLVIANTGADAAILAVADGTSNAVINFNGDDALALRHNGMLVDVIGQIGFDPGTEWGTGLASTVDNTIRRMTSVCAGDADGSNAFDPAPEWDGFANNTFNGLGSHTTSCGGVDSAPTVTAVSPSNGATNVPVDGNVEITFSEAVDATGSWFEILCASGVHTAVVSGGPTVFTLDPDVNFDNGEACTVTVFAAQVSDQDANDPPDTMDADFVSSFNTVGAVVANDLVINEVDYDQAGADSAEFVEIFNNDSVAVDLASYSVQMINGNLGGAVQYRLFALPSVALAAGDAFVLCSNSATVINCDLDVTPDADLIQNGAPDAIALLFNGTVIDTVSYEGDTGTPYTETSGVGLVDTAAGNMGISRCPNGADTDVNNVDFSERVITPGTANACTTDLQPTVTSTDPANSATNVSISGNITINFSEDVTTSGSWFTISCSTSGAHTATVSGGPQSFVLDPDANFAFSESCTGTVLAANVADQDGTPNNMAADYVFSFTTSGQPFGMCGDAATYIHDVQGSGNSSPLNGASGIILEGIVVGDYQAGGQFSGFHLQEQDADADADPATSEGIFAFNTSFAVNNGDLVRLRGSIVEFSSSGTLLTEITNLTDLIICSSGNSVTSTSVSLPVASISDWERYEGMLITISQELTVTENFTLGRFGEVALSVDGRLFNPTSVTTPGAPAIALQDLNNRSRILLDDGNNQQNIDPTIHPTGGLSAFNTLRSGDTVSSLTGVLEQRFGVYRVQPVGAVTFNPANPRPAEPEAMDGRLRVAATNVLNYFTTFDTIPGSNNGPYICGPSASLECRGANNAFEFARQRDKIINVIIELDADVVGLMEIENNPSASLQDLVDGLNAASAPGTYAFINTGTIGGDAIKVALLYRPATVTPVGAYAILDSTVDPTFIDTFNRPVLAQTFEENLTGERFTVAVNHLKSKGSACAGDPDIGDGQGNCNNVRLNAAIAEANWLAGDPTNSGDPDFIIVGDLNSYAKEDPISALEGFGFINLINTFVGPEAYSYVFGGQSGYLDHALATSTLTDQTVGAGEWHINADEPTVLDYNEEFKTPNQLNTFYSPEPFRASDHDPLVVGLDLVPQCQGQNATVYVDHNNKIVGGPLNGHTYHNTIGGTSGADVIVGTDSSDTILGLSGDDVICGGGGNDLISGGNGNDTIHAGAGNNTVLGESGNDTLFGGTGRDLLIGGLGLDTLAGDANQDLLDGGPGNDGLDGGSGTDLCNGGSGTDTGTACETKVLIP